jgi:hypothetical protein
VGEVLLDTSALIDLPERELGRAAVSVVSLAELERGVLLARSVAERTSRLTRLERARGLFRALPFDEPAAHEYAVLAARGREAGRNTRVLDMQIAATAIANGLTLVTRDREQAALVAGTILVA